jgi:hypothetical protein
MVRSFDSKWQIVIATFDLLFGSILFGELEDQFFAVEDGAVFAAHFVDSFV